MASGRTRTLSGGAGSCAPAVERRTCWKKRSRPEAYRSPRRQSPSPPAGLGEPSSPRPRADACRFAAVCCASSTPFALPARERLRRIGEQPAIVIRTNDHGHSRTGCLRRLTCRCLERTHAGEVHRSRRLYLQPAEGDASILPPRRDRHRVEPRPASRQPLGVFERAVIVAFDEARKKPIEASSPTASATPPAVASSRPGR